MRQEIIADDLNGEPGKARQFKLHGLVHEIDLTDEHYSKLVDALDFVNRCVEVSRRPGKLQSVRLFGKLTTKQRRRMRDDLGLSPRERPTNTMVREWMKSANARFVE